MKQRQNNLLSEISNLCIFSERWNDDGDVAFCKRKDWDLIGQLIEVEESSYMVK